MSSTTALLLLACVVLVSSQTCRPVHYVALHFKVCLSLDAISEDARGTTISPIRKSGVTVHNIKVEAFDLAGPRICSVKLDPNQNMKLTLGIRYLRITGDIVRKRLFKTRRGTFRATASNAVLTCTIPSNGSGRCVIPDDVQCSIDYKDSYSVSFTGKLLGIIAKRRIRDGIKRQIPVEVADVLEQELEESLSA